MHLANSQHNNTFEDMLNMKWAQNRQWHPFKSCVRQNFGAYFKRFKSYDSPATIATELFKPSMDSASLLVSIFKKVISFGWVGFVLVTSQRRHVFKFLTHFNWPWALIQWAIFIAQHVFGNEMIIRVYRALDWPSRRLEPKLCPKNHVVLKIPKTAEKTWVSHWRHLC